MNITGALVETDHDHVNSATGGKNVRMVVTTTEDRKLYQKLHVDVITDDWTCYEFSVNPENGRPQFERRIGRDGSISCSKYTIPDVVEKYLKTEFGGYN